MNLADISVMFDYNYWATALLLEAAAKVKPEQFVAAGPFPWGGLRGTLIHTLDAEYGWRLRLQYNENQDEDLKESDFPQLEDLEKRWREEENLMRQYLSGLDDKAVTSVVRYTTSTRVKRERVLWHCLYHVVNHGTQHRSEAAALLTDFGQSPGDVDFTFFMSEFHKG
jgi:uncharacterized damage-inducible protein DinB